MRKLAGVIAIMQTSSAAMADLLDQDFRKLASDEVVNLEKAYDGKVLLVVNTASKCGVLPHFEAVLTMRRTLPS